VSSGPRSDPQQELPHPELVALVQQLAVLAHAVYQRAVRAAQVLHEHARALVAEQGMGARDGGLVQHEVGVAPAADHRAGAVELPLQSFVEAALDAEQCALRRRRNRRFDRA